MSESCVAGTLLTTLSFVSVFARISAKPERCNAASAWQRLAHGSALQKDHATPQQEQTANSTLLSDMHISEEKQILVLS